nr:MAG TPA: hypothetical protein [Caudoviricetes sp.]
MGEEIGRDLSKDNQQYKTAVRCISGIFSGLQCHFCQHQRIR